MTTELLEVLATYSLPDWFAPTEAMEWHDNGRDITRDSPHERALFEAFPELTETCVDPQSKWVTLRLPLYEAKEIQCVDVRYHIDHNQRRLEAFLQRLEKS